MMLENGSASSRMHMAVEDVPLSTPPALPHVATPSTGPSMLLEAPEVLYPRPSLPSSPSHISHAMSPIVSHSPFAMPKRRWELGSDIQVAMVKLVSTMVTKLPGSATYAKFKAWLSAVEDWVASHLGTTLEVLGLHAARTVARLSMMLELYAILETTSVLGIQKGGGRPRGNTTW